MTPESGTKSGSNATVSKVMSVEMTFGARWTADELEDRYYEWLIAQIPEWGRYSVLLRSLYETPFRVILLMDENRVGDGLGMRNRYAYLCNLNAYERDILKQSRPCSVLEIMIGLAQRFEEEYMTLYSDEDPIGKWFWPMINSLGLTYYDDANFDRFGYSQIMETFLNRAYSPDGRGSLFYIPGSNTDMRQVEIWQQMMMFYEGGNTK